MEADPVPNSTTEPNRAKLKERLQKIRQELEAALKGINESEPERI
jgi:hypothetical protein